MRARRPDWRSGANPGGVARDAFSDARSLFILLFFILGFNTSLDTLFSIRHETLRALPNCYLHPHPFSAKGVNREYAH